jgi:predicted O-linked N-acetylglucosamine transferase (SPINDLY family)
VFACFQPPENTPAPVPPPAIERGFVTFGSLHRLEKINEDVVACWARLLNELPDSKLLIVRDQLDPWQRRRLLGQFGAHGIGDDRLELMPGHESGGSFQEFWAEIDIYLDCFPWSGHTMACHALWAGVPVVTLQGQSHASRMVASKLVALGRKSWIADGEAAYRAIAAGLAQDVGALAKIREKLRAQMAESPVMDGERFARNFEAAISDCLEGLEPGQAHSP